MIRIGEVSVSFIGKIKNDPYRGSVCLFHKDALLSGRFFNMVLFQQGFQSEGPDPVSDSVMQLSNPISCRESGSVKLCVATPIAIDWFRPSCKPESVSGLRPLVMSGLSDTSQM